MRWIERLLYFLLLLALPVSAMVVREGLIVRSLTVTGTTVFTTIKATGLSTTTGINATTVNVTSLVDTGALNVSGLATLSGGLNTTALNITDANNITLGSTSGTSFGTATTQKLSFYGVTAVVQPATTGTVTGFTAGASTATKVDSTYTGGVGSTAYTTSDIVLALKQTGLLKQ